MQPVIHPYFPFFHLDVRADVLVFRPQPGMLLCECHPGARRWLFSSVLPSHKQPASPTPEGTLTCQPPCPHQLYCLPWVYLAGARVNVLQADLIGALVLGVFNVAIPAASLGSEWEYQPEVGTRQPSFM